MRAWATSQARTVAYRQRRARSGQHRLAHRPPAAFCRSRALTPVPSWPLDALLLDQARRMHSHAVVAIDWSYDNSQLLSVGLGGSLVVWDTAALLQGEGTAAGGAGAAGAAGGGARGPAGGGPEGTASGQQQHHVPEVNPIRTIWVPTATFLCGK